MAEITDRVPEAATGPDVDAGLPPVRDDSATYRPLSVLALGGFGLAVVSATLICLGGWIAICTRHYILFIVLVLLAPAGTAVVCFMLGVFNPMKILKGAAFALAGALAGLGFVGLLLYSSTDPWLLSWELVVPAAGVLVLWIARSQILRSEDTLGGLTLCNWGLGLLLVFGLLYAAYYTASTLAVRGQSEAFAEEWLGLVQKGELDKAFARTLPPDQRPAEDDKLRSQLETYLNEPTIKGPGPYGEFCVKPYVRLLEGTSTVAKVERLGLIESKYEGEVFSERYGYRLTTPTCVIEMDVAVMGRDSTSDRYKGRQWWIDPRQTGWNLKTPPVMTDLGAFVVQQNGPIRDFIDEWFTNWYHDEEAAYLLTLPAAQRSEVQRRRPVSGLALGGSSLWTEPGRLSFYSGGLIDADQKRFFSLNDKERPAVVTALKKSFRPGEDKPSKTEVDKQVAMPLVQPVDGGVQLSFDLHFIFDDSQSDVKMVNVDARIIVQCDEASLAAKNPKWQVLAIQLIRARSTNQASNQGPGPRPIRMTPPTPPTAPGGR
jgi:hypothetical protein